MRTHLLSIAFLAACTYTHVGSGEVAVVQTPHGIDPRVYPPGDWKFGSDELATIYSRRVA